MSITTGIFGTLTDYTTGSAIRPATADEWRSTADMVNGTAPGHENGVWRDEDDRSVWVDGGPEAEVTDSDIRALSTAAGAAGDMERVILCGLALGAHDGEEFAEFIAATVTEAADAERIKAMDGDTARAECVRVILDNRVNTAGE